MRFPCAFLALAALLGPAPAPAAEINNIPELSSHHRLLVVRKTQNPENLLAVYSRADRACRFSGDDEVKNQPAFNFYWLMNGSTYKPVNPMIKSQIRSRMTVQPGGSRNQFLVRLEDLSAVRHDLQDPTLVVKAEQRDGRCDVAAYLQLGPSEQNAYVRVTNLFVEAMGSLFGVNVQAVTVVGTDVATGRAVSHRYRGAGNVSR